MGRSDDLILPPDTPWLADTAAQALCAALEKCGHQALFVGGCVRNAVLGEAVSDIDISTDARPHEVQEIAVISGFKAVPTGVSHGTVTVVVEGRGFEVTTFRRDVETDGRRAVVAFSDDIEDDARRRDFTMNALYTRRDGRVVDPLGGLADTLARRVRFIENAEIRIREDFLRILRFFRFNAWYANPDEGFQAEDLAAIAACADGLETLSAERIGSEMLKLLTAPNPAPAVATMEALGLFSRILPIESPAALAPLVHIEELAAVAPEPIRRLAALNPHDARTRLRLSNVVSTDLDRLIECRDGGYGPRALGFLLGADRGFDVQLLRAAGLSQPVDAGDRTRVSQGAATDFPIKAKDLMPDFAGAALGAKLGELRARWLESDLKLNRDMLLG